MYQKAEGRHRGDVSAEHAEGGGSRVESEEVIHELVPVATRSLSAKRAVQAQVPKLWSVNAHCVQDSS